MSTELLPSFSSYLAKMQPKISYTIWFSQRNGSSLLCEGLKSTGIAGRPEELFNFPSEKEFLDHYKPKNHSHLQELLWEKGSTSNGVFGVKANAPRKENDWRIEQLKLIQGLNLIKQSHAQVWEYAFPNHRHIFLTRRNKVRQAVSWWKAIVSQEWHRKNGTSQPYTIQSIKDKYNFDALKHLLIECSLREAKIQDLLSQAKATPLTIVYEDFVQNYEETIKSVIGFLGIREEMPSIATPYYKKLADDLTEEWVERFRKEVQRGWEKVVW